MAFSRFQRVIIGFDHFGSELKSYDTIAPKQEGTCGFCQKYSG